MKAGNYAPALFDSKGRIRRDHVRVNGTDELHRRRQLLSSNVGTGENAVVKPSVRMLSPPPRKRGSGRPNSRAIRDGVIPALVAPSPEPGARHRIETALQKYTEYIQYHRSLRTFRTYRPILAAFRRILLTHLYR